MSAPDPQAGHVLLGHGWGPPLCQVPPLTPAQTTNLTCPVCARILALLQQGQTA